jgi:hypothetical protein
VNLRINLGLNGSSFFLSVSLWSRSFHTSPTPSADSGSSSPKKSPFDNLKLEGVDVSRVVQLSNEGIAKLQAASTEQLFHWTSYGLAGLTPVAFILSPSLLNFPVDFALGLLIPVHMHIGLVGVIEDYIPRPQQGLSRFVMAVLSVLTAIGLLKINLCGAGITESVKSVWREPKDVKRIKQGDKVIKVEKEKA